MRDVFKGTFIDQDKVTGVEGVGKPWKDDATEYAELQNAQIFKNAGVVLAATPFFSILKDWQRNSDRKISKVVQGSCRPRPIG